MSEFVKKCSKIKIKIRDWNPDIHTNIAYIQEKKDGYFVKVIVDEKRIVHVRGKKEDYSCDLFKTNQFHFQDLPSETCILGELYVPGKPATDVITAMKENWPDLKFCGFAIPFLDRGESSFLDLLDVNNILRNHGIEFPSTLHCKTQLGKEFLLAEIVRKGYEGFVLKESHMAGWYKLKPVKTIDVIITGWERSFSGQFFGDLGALQISIYKDGVLTRIGKVGGGFTPELRKLINADDVGRVIEVGYQSIQAKGGLQFPRFIRFRNDKSPEECTEDQLV